MDLVYVCVRAWSFESWKPLIAKTLQVLKVESWSTCWKVPSHPRLLEWNLLMFWRFLKCLHWGPGPAHRWSLFCAQSNAWGITFQAGLCHLIVFHQKKNVNVCWYLYTVSHGHIQVCRSNENKILVSQDKKNSNDNVNATLFLTMLWTLSLSLWCVLRFIP